MMIVISLFIYQLLLTIDASHDANIFIINTNMKLSNEYNNDNDNIIKMNNVIFSLSGCVLMKIMIKLNIQLYIDYFTINPVIIIDNVNDNVYNDNIYIQLYLLSSKTYYFITKILTNDKNINYYHNNSRGNSSRIINHDISLSYDSMYYLQFDLLYLRMIDAYSLTKYSSTEIHCTFHHNSTTTNNDSNTNSSVSIFSFLVSTTTSQNNHDQSYYHLKNMISSRYTYELIKTLHGDSTAGITSSGMTRNSIISKSTRSSSSGINIDYSNEHQQYHGWQMFLKDDKLLSSTLSLTDLIYTSTFNYIYPSSSLSSFSRSSSSLLSLSSSSTSSSTSTSIYKHYINLNQTSKLTKQLQQCLLSNKVLFLGDSHMEKNFEYLLKYDRYLYKQWYFMKDGHGIYMKLFHNYHYHEHKNTVSNDKIDNGYSHHHHHHKIQHVQHQNNKISIVENQKHVNIMNNNIYKKNDNKYYQKIQRTSRYLKYRKNPAIKSSIISRDDKIKNKDSKSKTHDDRIDEDDRDPYEYLFLNSNITISSTIDNQIKNKNIIIFKTGRLLTRLRDLTYDHLINLHNYQKIVINSGSWDLRDINVNYYIKHIDELFDELLLFRLRHDHNHQLLYHQGSSNTRKDYNYNHNLHIIWMSTPSYSFRKPYAPLQKSIIRSSSTGSSSSSSSSSSLNMIERRTNIKIAIAEQYIENKCREYNITYVPYFDISIVFHRFSIDTHHYIDNDSKVMAGRPHIGLIQLNYLLNAICNTS